ncbi:MAG: flagellar hook-basal body complex protein FliE [Deltaproteobacteria bacterium]|nr:flagellar hook-basal body complex protein FliE [Deltaproteobacteria bacterium]
MAPEIPGQAPEGSRSFTNYLAESIDKANEIQMQADTAAKELIAGRNKNIHETMLMLEKADMSFRLMMQVRNKVIDAYREIMRMQV